MKRARCAVVLLGLVLAGCGPGVVGPSEPPVEAPVEATAEVVVPTPSPSPSPTWSVEQQGAIDAVQRYWEVWTRISQNLDTADWNDLHEVADETAVSLVFEIWAGWKSEGYYLVGSPSFTATSVMESRIDYSQGTTYSVRGCYSIESATLVGPSGQPTGNRGPERTVNAYRVLHSIDGTFIVTEAMDEKETC